jgi:ankyrin repeat protein
MVHRECEFLDIVSVIEIAESVNCIRFLWVHFQLVDLCDATSDFDIREALRNLPEGMAETYARISRKIGRSQTNITLAQRIFKWIVCARRPLLLTELGEAVAFRPTDRLWDARKIPNVSHLIQTCGNLVIFDEEDKTVRLAHHTVQQFLLGPPVKDSISEFHFQLSQADIEAGDTCVAYLSFLDFETQITTSEPKYLLLVSAMPSPAAVLDRTTSTLGLRDVTIGIFKFRQYLRSRSTKHQMLDFDLGKFVKLKKQPQQNLQEKYLFLDYAIKNWIGHTSNFSEDNTTMWESFKNLAMGKPMPFDVRIWDDSTASHHLPYMPLFRWAIDAGHVPLLKLLLQLPAGSNLRTYCRQEYEEGRSVILNAAQRGHANVIEILASQACIDRRDRTPLLKAAENGHDFAVQLLLKYKLCLEGKTEALHIASQRGHAAVMRLLLKDEPPLDLGSGWGKVMFTEATGRRSDEVLVVLLDKAADFEVAIRDVEKMWGNTALHVAIEKGLNDTAQLLLEKGADANAKSDDGQTALHIAVKEGREALVQLLLEKGADANAESDDGQTALHIAVRDGHEALVQLLLEKGADANAKNKFEWTPLHRAAKEGHEALVLLLLEKGADANAKGSKGWAVLHQAAYNGHETLVQLLLEKGADATATGENGLTLLHLAANNGHEAVVQLLLEKGAEADAKGSNGWTALHQATYYGHEAVVQLLLEKGANSNAKSNVGWTVLHQAAGRGHEAVVQLLLEKGADANAMDDDGRTALQLAADNTHEAVVQLLLKKGATKSNDGWTVPTLVQKETMDGLCYTRQQAVGTKQ